MSIILKSENCKQDSNFKCENCNRQYKGIAVAICRSGILWSPTPSTKKRIIYRSRTDNEIKEVRAICKLCPHRTEGGGDYDAGLCMLKMAGCSSCNSIEKFLLFQQSGRPCPDKPPRFPGTELVDLTTEPKSD